REVEVSLSHEMYSGLLLSCVQLRSLIGLTFLLLYLADLPVRLYLLFGQNRLFRMEPAIEKREHGIDKAHEQMMVFWKEDLLAELLHALRTVHLGILPVDLDQKRHRSLRR